jgi:hypothetical protein
MYWGHLEVRFGNWRNDPFFYRAFKIAIGRLLDALEPPGPITAPQFTSEVEDQEKSDHHMARWVDSMRRVEARAEYAANHVIGLFRTLPRITDEQREENIRLVGGLHTSLMNQFYAMPDAARDLAFKPRVEPKAGETVELTANVETIKLNLKTGDSNG